MLNNIEHITSYFNKLKGSNNYKYYELQAESYERINKMISDLYKIINIDEAYGIHLDRIGKRVGQPRNTANDDIYRLYIKTKIIANKSKGDIPTMKQVAKVLFGDSFIDIVETWNDTVYGDDIAGVVLKLRPDELGEVPSMMELVKAGGVKMYYEAVLPNESIIIEENHFTGKAKYQLSGRTKTESKKVNSNSEEILISDNYFKNIVKYEKSGRVKTKSVESGVSHENLSLNEKNHMGRVKYLKTGKAICGGGRL